MTAASLAQLIPTLPQELFDTIYGLVFASDKNRVEVTAAYKPPVQLQVDRASRQLFASIYYGGTTFILEPSIGHKWIASLATGAFDTISSLEVHGKPGTTACQLRNSFTRMMESERLQLSGADWPAYNTGLHAPRYNFAFKNASSGPLHSRWYVQWVKRVLVCEKVQSWGAGGRDGSKEEVR